VSPIATGSECVIITSETTQNGTLHWQAPTWTRRFTLASRGARPHVHVSRMCEFTYQYIIHEDQARCVTANRAISYTQCMSTPPASPVTSWHTSTTIPRPKMSKNISPPSMRIKKVLNLVTRRRPSYLHSKRQTFIVIAKPNSQNNRPRLLWIKGSPFRPSKQPGKPLRVSF
jgi:hypothetical protein